MATSVEKAFKIIAYLVDHFEGRGIIEISNNLDVHRSTVHRLLKVLEKYNFVEKNKSRGKYQLGKRMIQIGSIALSNFGLCQIAKPFIERVRNKTKEATYLATFSKDEVLYLDYKESMYGVAAIARPGMRLPAHCTSTGKIFLAFGPTHFRERVLLKPLRSYTKNTITNLQTLKKELETVKRRGYALSRNEYEQGITAIAAPIFYEGKNLIGAIAIAGPSNRLKITPLIDILRKSSREISKILGEKG
jgi:DNA-binding IclR family transcriptional regulator